MLGHGRTRGRFHKWPGSDLCLLSMPSSTITSQRSSKLDEWEAGELEGMVGAKGESEEKEEAFWFIFKDASYCIFNHLPHAHGRLDSWLREWLNSHPIESSHSGGSDRAFFSLPLLSHFYLNSPVLSLLISIPARLTENRRVVWMLTWAVKCFKRQGDVTKPSPCTTKPRWNFVTPWFDWRIPTAPLYSHPMRLVCNLDFRWRCTSVRVKNSEALCYVGHNITADTGSYILQKGAVKCCSDSVKTNAWDSWGLGLTIRDG